MRERSVFITGAATGIGRATSLLLAVEGWRVFAGVLPFQVEQARVGAPATLEVLPLDVTQAESVAEAARLVEGRLGGAGLAALINNAGVADVGSGVLAGIRIEDVQRLFDINVFGPLRVTQAFLPMLHTFGPARIINMSSGAVRVPVPTAGAYNMSKFAVEGFTKTLRYELAPFGIEVVAIEPGGVRTPMTDGAEANLQKNWASMPAPVRARYEAVLRPANERLVAQLEKANEPEDIARGIVTALEVERPKPRYCVGKEVRPLPALQALTTERMFEDILLKQFGLSRGSELARRD